MTDLRFTGSAEFALVHEKDFFVHLEEFPVDANYVYEFVFHGAFAKRLYDIMKREGPSIQGFDRMQQSFTDSVNTIRTMLMEIEETYKIPTSQYMEKSADGIGRLLKLIEDVSLFKNWQLQTATEERK